MYSDFGSFLITLLWFFILVMFLMIWFQILVDLFSDHKMGGGAKVLWVIFLIAVPPLAALIYIIVRGKGMGERRQAQVVAAQEAQAAYIKNVAGTGGAADQIAQAKALLDSGTITQAEFDAIKAKALS